MDAGLASHGDAFNVIPVDSQVGALDGNRDPSLYGSITRNDLHQEIWGKCRSLLEDSITSVEKLDSFKSVDKQQFLRLNTMVYD